MEPKFDVEEPAPGEYMPCPDCNSRSCCAKCDTRINRLAEEVEMEENQRRVIRWALKWRSKNKIDGEREFFMWNYQAPYLFATRREAREYRDKRWGYIRDRPDLREEPHGWRLPKVVKVSVILEEL